MNAPSWLTALISMLSLAVAGFALWRLLVARAWNRKIDYQGDILQLAAGVATAGIVASWARTLPRGVWAVLFAAAGVYFAVLLVRARMRGGSLLRPAGALGCCAALVYMLTAGVGPSTLHGSTAGQYTMAGMPGMILDQTERFPALGLLFVVAAAFAAVFAVNRVGSMPKAEPVKAVGGPDDGAPLPLVPRAAHLSQVVLVLVFAYAILTKLV